MSDSTAGSEFTFTDADINLAGVLALASTIPGTCISFLALLAYAAIACYKRARAKLDRVSFRLMVYTLVFNILFGIAYAATPSAPGPLCDFGAFAVNFTLSFSTFFTTCIALNLQLVLVHGVNGKQMEKYYVVATALLSIALNVPTYALHQFGWNEDTGTCWYSNANPSTRLKWIIGTQSFWITLAATIEMVCSCVVLAWMYRFQRVTAVMMKVASRAKPQALDAKEKKGADKSDSVLRPITLVMRDKRYRKVILRIAMYPIVSLIVNYTTVILDLNTTVHGLNTQRDFNLLILDLIFYGIRPLAYGLLAVTDPAFINAVRELRKKGQSPNGHSTNSERTITQLDFAPGVLSPSTTAHGTISYVGKDNSREMVQEGQPIEQGSVDSSLAWGIDGAESGRSTIVDEEMRRFERQL